MDLLLLVLITRNNLFVDLTWWTVVMMLPTVLLVLWVDSPFSFVTLLCTSLVRCESSFVSRKLIAVVPLLCEFVTVCVIAMLLILCRTWGTLCGLTWWGTPV